MKPSSIEIHVLGSFRVAVDGQRIPEERWRQRKAALLLQRLALEPTHRPHAEQLMEFLWPEGDAESARNGLYKTIHSVRSALESGLRRPADSHFLLTRGAEAILTAPERLWIDAEAFGRAATDALTSADPAAMEAAVALYESPLLPAEPYEPWIAGRREHLRTTFLELHSALAGAHQARGDHDRAIELLHRVIATDPANESAHQSLMRVYMATGRRQLAIRQYRDCSSALRRELDAAPDAATVELYQRVVGGAPAPAARLAVLPFETGAGDPARRSSDRAHGDDACGWISRLGAVYERPLSGMAGLHDEISAAVAAELGLTGGGVHKRYSANSEAYRLYLRGRHLWQKRTLDSVTRAIGYFQKAIEVDAGSAPAWVGLCDAYALLGDVGVAATPPMETFSKARIAAIRAVEIDNQLAEAHTSLAHLYMHEYHWPEADREFESALRLNPNDVGTLIWLSNQRIMTGRTEEGFEKILRALEPQPLSIIGNTDYAHHLYAAREFQAAVDQYQKALELDPHFLPACVGLGRTLAELGRYDDALSAFERAKDVGGERSEVVASLACVHARGGKRPAAAGLLARLDEAAKSQYVSLYSVATVHAALGQTDDAFAWLSRACEQHAA